jgi:hypothetical protein
MHGFRLKRRWTVLAVLSLGAAIGGGVAYAALSATVVADTNTVREKIVHNQFTPDATTPMFSSRASCCTI